MKISKELSWFDNQFIILSQFLTMPKKSKIRSINVSKKLKTQHIKSESKTSIEVIVIYFFILSAYPFVNYHMFLGKFKVEPKLLKYISVTLTDHFLSGLPKYHSLIE